MMRRFWKVAGLVAVLALLVVATASAAAPVPPEGTNKLRVYGRGGELTPFPYTQFDAPFNLKSPEAPPKDFVVFNPALLRDFDLDSHGMFGDFFRYIESDGYDAHEKVHARMWYQPEYPEPRGETEPEVVEPMETADIVLEYTYLMLDYETLNPNPGREGTVKMVFPIAGFDPDDPMDPPGLDSYDVDLNGTDEPEIMSVDEINPNYFNGIANPGTPLNSIAVSAKRTAGGASGRLYEGEAITFFDYMVEVADAPTTEERKVRLNFWYVGYGYDRDPQWLGAKTLFDGDFASVDARVGPVRLNTPPMFVDRPFWITLDAISDGYVKLTPHRLLKAGETFFVDGAEYDVAGIGVVMEDGIQKLKYITIRNPIPKGKGEVEIDDMTVYKQRLPRGESIWMLPPFSYEHDMIDDINIPSNDYIVHDDPNDFPLFVDQQLRDNVVDEYDRCYGPMGYVYGCESFLHRDYNTILDRVVEDVGPLNSENFIAWSEETREERFDSSLMEEKFFEFEYADEFTIGHMWWWEVIGEGDGQETLFGPVQPNMKFDTDTSSWTADDSYFADCNQDGNIDENDVWVWFEGGDFRKKYHPDKISTTEGWVRLDIAPQPGADVEVYYCRSYKFPYGIDPIEIWEWINVETHPWDYTEFILPQLPDKPTEDGYDRGDFLLVSSFMTEDSRDVVSPGSVRVKFDYDAEIGKVDSADVYVQDAEYNSIFRDVEANSLRVYGRCDENAAFPYYSVDGPFSVDTNQAPSKDFVVFNPAYLYHKDDPLLSGIKADGDANQKVHLRMWYVPKYDEPAGRTSPPVAPDEKDSNWDAVEMGDIVMEYTYLLLDDATNDPTHGGAQKTKMVFPMAGSQVWDIPTASTGDPIGLDSYDVNADGNDEIMSIEHIVPNAIVVSPEPRMGGDLVIGDGECLEFLDWMVCLGSTATEELKADLEIYYTGQRKDRPLFVETVQLWQDGSPLPAGDNAALVGFSPYGVKHTVKWTPGDWLFDGQAIPVDQPFFFVLEYVGTNEVAIKPYRWLVLGESIFVDGAEYDISGLWTVGTPDGLEFKYLTVRNPLPKGEGALAIRKLTRFKSRVAAGEPLPVLPPFDREHDIIDDVEIPTLNTLYNLFGIDLLPPDLQLIDNDVDEAENLPPEFPPGTGLFWGENSLIHELFNTIAERRIEGVEPLEVTWIAEEKEPRFDTNLTEEKFTEPDMLVLDFVFGELLALDHIEELDDPGNWPPNADDDVEWLGYWGPTKYDIADCNFDGVIDYKDVRAYVNGVEVPVLLVDAANNLVVLDSSAEIFETVGPDNVDVTLDYCYQTPIGGEYWRWLNIETFPWDYTEFVLPDIPDITEAAGLTGPDFRGDYLVVSSWLTEDSENLDLQNGPADAVRVKFDYDGYGDADGTMADEPTDGLGIYVNHCLETVGISSLTSDSPVEQGIPMNFTAEFIGTPTKITWDFGDGGAGTLLSGGQETGEYLFADAGEYRVTLTVENDCFVQSKSILVKVLPLNADVDGDGDVDFDDVLEVLRHWGARITDPDWPDHEHADVNEDGAVNIFDIMLVLKVYLGM